MKKDTSIQKIDTNADNAIFVIDRKIYLWIFLGRKQTKGQSISF